MKLLSPIIIFMIASAGIHGGLILMSDSAELTLPGTTGSVMRVKLENKTQEIIQRDPEKPQQKNINKTIRRTQTLDSFKKVATKTKETQQKSSLQKKTNAISKAHVVSIIYKQLNNHFKYPRIAQRRNWQGQVLLAFRLTSAGNIKDIKINHSSGYNVLDQAAIVALQKIGQLPQVTSWLNDGMEIQIPIIYQLTEG